MSAIKGWEVPRSMKGVRNFLGFANYYRDFISRFSHIAIPLIALTKKDAPFRWTDQCQKAFILLKNLLIEALILAQ
jgi:hypothetical protein